MCSPSANKLNLIYKCENDITFFQNDVIFATIIGCTFVPAVEGEYSALHILTIQLT